MKKLLIASLAAASLLVGCANQILTQPMSQAQILSQINTVICPGSKVILDDLQIPAMGIPAPLVAKIPQLNDDISTVCADGAIINSANLQTLVDSSLPILLQIVQLIPGPQQTPAVIAIGAAQALLPLLISQVKAIEAAAPVPTVAPVVIPAPAATK